MNKKGIVLRVSDYTNSKIDWQMDAYKDGITIGIEAYDISETQMIDDHVASIFEELEDIDIMDESEGFMSYEGDLNAPKLVSQLQSMGFVAKLV